MYKGTIMELIKLKKGDKTITRTRFDYEKNLIHWKLRGFEPVKDKPIEDKPKIDKVEKPKKKKDK
jgi:hypothetical protein|tara:strand:+ start:10311 stop:10505 length:195 start_codon:yes stop_codon:yes gene_type:complete